MSCAALEHVTFSRTDPDRLSEFWSALLDYERAPAGDSWIASDPREEDVRLLFNKMPKSETIEMPIHLDVNVPDREAELERVLQLGGHLVETKSYRIGNLFDTYTVMRDPEGNGFCLEGAPNTERAYLERHLRVRPASRAGALLGLRARLAGRGDRRSDSPPVPTRQRR